MPNSNKLINYQSKSLLIIDQLPKNKKFILSLNFWDASEQHAFQLLFVNIFRQYSELGIPTTTFSLRSVKTDKPLLNMRIVIFSTNPKTLTDCYLQFFKLQNLDGKLEVVDI